MKKIGKIDKSFQMVGHIMSYVWPQYLAKVFTRIKKNVYTGWKSRVFKELRGYLNGNVTINGGEYITIGKDSIVFEGASLNAWDTFGEQRFTPQIEIGRNTVIQKNVFISSTNKVIIGDNVAITDYTVILDNVHGDFQDNHLTFNVDPEIPDVFLQNVQTRHVVSKGPVIIEDNVHIGMFSMILPKTTIGHNSVIAAHSVVSGRIPPYSLVAGNPAEVIMTFGRKKK